MAFFGHSVVKICDRCRAQSQPVIGQGAHTHVPNWGLVSMLHPGSDVIQAARELRDYCPKCWPLVVAALEK